MVRAPRKKAYRLNDNDNTSPDCFTWEVLLVYLNKMVCSDHPLRAMGQIICRDWVIIAIQSLNLLAMG